MAMPSKFEVIASGTGGDNVTVDTGIFDTRNYDSVGFYIALIGGVVAGTPSNTLYGYDIAGTTYVMAKGTATTTGAGTIGGGWGPGVTAGSNGGTVVQAPVPAKMKLVYPAFGAGITSTWIVYGRRSHRGPDATITAD